MTTLLCQNGQPLLLPGDKRLHPWVIPAKNGHVTLTYRGGSMGFLLTHNLLRVSETVEDLTLHDTHGHLIVDDWGEAVRPVRGQVTGYSNHGGYAADGNATRHPLGRQHTFTPRQRVAIHQTLKMYDGCIRWGGDYQGRKDEMHWEVIGSMAHCERVARHLLTSPRGKRILAANPGQRAVILS